jgi:hypothetical protein
MKPGAVPDAEERGVVSWLIALGNPAIEDTTERGIRS